MPVQLVKVINKRRWSSEGIPAIICGLFTFWILPDYPETAKFLEPHEKLAVTSRLSENAPTKSSKTWDPQQVIKLVIDPTFWTFNFAWIFHAVGGFGLSYVLPTVIFDLGKPLLFIYSK